MKSELLIVVGIALCTGGCVKDIGQFSSPGGNDKELKQSSNSGRREKELDQPSSPFDAITEAPSPVTFRQVRLGESVQFGSNVIIILHRLEGDAAFFRRSGFGADAGSVYRIELEANIGDRIAGAEPEFLMEIGSDNITLAKYRPIPDTSDDRLTGVKLRPVRVGETVRLGSNVVAILDFIDEDGAYFRTNVSGAATGNVYRVEPHANLRDRIPGADPQFLTSVYSDRVTLGSIPQLSKPFPSITHTISHGFRLRRVRVGEIVQLGPKVVVILDRVEAGAAFFRRNDGGEASGAVYRIERGKNVRDRIVDAQSEFVSEIGPNGVTLKTHQITVEQRWPDGKTEIRTVP